MKKIDALNRALAEKKRMIANLMKVLAMSEESSVMFAYTKSEVERLDSEIRSAETELVQLSYLNEQDNRRSEQIDILVKSLGEFRERFEELSVVEKRNFMRRIVDRIEWDGENAHIFLKHAGEQ